MSEDQTKTQTTAVGSLPGGVDEIRGSETDRAVTDSMSFGSSRFCKGANIEANSAPVAARDGQNVLGVTGRSQERARPVDAKQVGSNPGDHRAKVGDVAKSSLTQAAEGDGSGPRSHTGQAPTIGKSGAVNGAFGKDFKSQTWPEVDAGD